MQGKAWKFGDNIDTDLCERTCELVGEGYVERIALRLGFNKVLDVGV